jgi:L-ascorbate metabolism protein UlaG (beta-lactamase superfamily)
MLSACGVKDGVAESTVDPGGDASTDAGKIETVAGGIVWLHSTNPWGNPGIRLDAGGKVIYLDPVDPIGLDAMPKADVILVTHPHVDHFSAETIARLAKTGTVVVSTKEIGDSLSGVDFQEVAPGQTTSAGGLEIEGIPAYNDDHAIESGYVGFVLVVDGVRIYCSGDTGLTPEMKSLTRIDIAVLNVRKYYSLSGEDAATFARTVKPQILIPIHWIPGDVRFGDPAELEILRRNMPATTELRELTFSG